MVSVCWRLLARPRQSARQHRSRVCHRSGEISKLLAVSSFLFVYDELEVRIETQSVFNRPRAVAGPSQNQSNAQIYPSVPFIQQAFFPIFSKALSLPKQVQFHKNVPLRQIEKVSGSPGPVPTDSMQINFHTIC